MSGSFTSETAEVTAMRVYDAMGFIAGEWTGTAAASGNGLIRLTLLHKRNEHISSTTQRWLVPTKRGFEDTARSLWADMKQELKRRPFDEQEEANGSAEEPVRVPAVPEA